MQSLFTRRYTEEAVRLIRENRGKPFSSICAQHAARADFYILGFDSKSANSVYGDVIEGDWLRS